MGSRSVKDEQQVLWKVVRPNKKDAHCHTFIEKRDLHRTRLLKNDVEQAASDLFDLVSQNKADGLISIIFQEDQTMYFAIAGKAITDNVRASGATNHLIELLNSLSQDSGNFSI